jgi:hypothetical protein
MSFMHSIKRDVKVILLIESMFSILCGGSWGATVAAMGRLAVGLTHNTNGADMARNHFTRRVL